MFIVEEHLLTKVARFKSRFYFTVILQVTLELTVLDYDMLGGSDPIGKVNNVSVQLYISTSCLYEGDSGKMPKETREEALG